jgi:hypothetical protein
MLFAFVSENHMFPSAPSTIPAGWLLAVCVAVSATEIELPGVNSAVFDLKLSVNQISRPSVVMPFGPLEAVGTLCSVIDPEGVIRPTLLALISVNQRLPSGPVVMPVTPLDAVGVENSLTAPVGWMRPTLPPNSVHQTFPSGRSRAATRSGRQSELLDRVVPRGGRVRGRPAGHAEFLLTGQRRDGERSADDGGEFLALHVNPPLPERAEGERLDS